MTIEQHLRDAFDDLDELLLEGIEIDNAITRAAASNDLKRNVLSARALRQFGDLEVHRANLARAAAWREQDREQERAYETRAKEIREAASTDAESTYYACCLDDPAHAGRPSWPYCIERLTDRLQINDSKLKLVALEAVYATVRHLDRKNGTRTAHYQ